ncbi:MAG: acyl carrier protein [Coriobacteriaceae bacterium]|nr:acyl carrier protein [Coriobacteriaceae bacterium]
MRTATKRCLRRLPGLCGRTRRHRASAVSCALATRCRARLPATWNDGRYRRSLRMATAEEIKARAREIMAQDLPEDYNPEMTDDEPLIVEGGVDSLGFIQVLTKLEAEFNAHVPDEEWWEVSSLNELADAIVRNVRD